MNRSTCALAVLCLAVAAAAVFAQVSRPQPKALAFFTYTTFRGMIDPGSAFAEKLGLTSAQKNELSRLNGEYLCELNADKEPYDLLDKNERERRDAMARKRFLRYDADVKRLLTAGQKSRYEALKRQRAIDSIADEFAWRNIKVFDSGMLKRLNLADWQESRLAALNEAFAAKMKPLWSEAAEKAAYGKYEADVREMLSREQNEVFDDVLYSLSWEAVPEGFAKGLPKKPAPPAEVYKDPEEEPVKIAGDPKVGFPGMHFPANTYIRELELYPEQLKRLDALNRKYTNIFSDKYLLYVKDFLRKNEAPPEKYTGDDYKKMLEENRVTGGRYEEEFKRLLFPEQHREYADSSMGRSLKSYAFRYRGGGYGLFYEPGYLEYHSVRLRPEQIKALLDLNKTAAEKMLRLAAPGDRGRVYMEYEKAVTDMLDEEQRRNYYMMFSSSGFFPGLPKKRSSVKPSSSGLVPGGDLRSRGALVLPEAGSPEKASAAEKTPADPSVGFPGMNRPTSEGVAELGLGPEQVKGLDALNRRFTKLFTEKYFDYLKDFLQKNEESGDNDLRKGYEKLIKEWTALGDSYEEEFKKLLSAGQRSRYTEYRKRFVNSHGLMLFGYGDFYDAGFLQKHEVELTPKQKETLRQINRTYINEMLGHEKPGERTAVYMEYEKALKDMFDEEQWYYYLHKFDGFKMPRPKTGAGGKK